jgi:hypothetical protein
VTARRYAGPHYVYRLAVALEPHSDRLTELEVVSEDGSFAEGSPVAIRLADKPLALVVS